MHKYIVSLAGKCLDYFIWLLSVKYTWLPTWEMCTTGVQTAMWLTLTARLLGIAVFGLFDECQWHKYIVSLAGKCLDYFIWLLSVKYTWLPTWEMCTTGVQT